MLAARVLHTLKGLAATVGARHLAGVAAYVEARLKPDGVTLSAADHDELLKTLQLAIDAVAQSLATTLAHYAPIQRAQPSSDDALPGEGSQTNPLGADLIALSILLADSNMEALFAVEQLRARHGHALGGALDALAQSVAALDFPAALAQCKALQPQ